MFLHINDIIWRIRFVSNYDSSLLKTDGTYALGACYNNTKTIYINSNLYGNLLRRVLSHEITHAVIFSQNIVLDYEQEELFANLITNYGKEILELTELIINKGEGI